MHTICTKLQLVSRNFRRHTANSCLLQIAQVSVVLQHTHHIGHMKLAILSNDSIVMTTTETG